MLPVISVGGVTFGIVVAYTMLAETVFQWPGLGLMFLEAITRSDIPLIVAYLMVVGLIFVVTNTLVDLIYGLVNPTVKLTGKKARSEEHTSELQSRPHLVCRLLLE